MALCVTGVMDSQEGASANSTVSFFFFKAIELLLVAHCMPYTQRGSLALRMPVVFLPKWEGYLSPNWMGIPPQSSGVLLSPLQA